MVRTGGPNVPSARELFLKQKAAVKMEIERMNRALDMLKFKCWYYGEAIEDRKEDRLKRIKPADIPNEIRQAYENAHHCICTDKLNKKAGRVRIHTACFRFTKSAYSFSDFASSVFSASSAVFSLSFGSAFGAAVAAGAAAGCSTGINSMIAISAASPRRGPIFVMRV